jgi:hypothetical protein
MIFIGLRDVRIEVSAELFQVCRSCTKVELVLIDTEYFGIDISSPSF